MTQTMLSERADEESLEQTSQPWNTRLEGNIFVTVHTFPDRRVSHSGAFPPRFPSSTCSLLPCGLTPEKLHTPHNKAPGTCLAEEKCGEDGRGPGPLWDTWTIGPYEREVFATERTYGHRQFGMSQLNQERRLTPGSNTPQLR